jgi:hypothetical protein
LTHIQPAASASPAAMPAAAGESGASDRKAFFILNPCA